MENKTAVIETISTINRGSGLSNNVMAYRLALMMENSPPSPSPVNTSERERLQVQDELRKTLSQKSQQIEIHKQTLKNKYYQEYLQKFGVSGLNQASSSVTQPQLDAPNRVDKLINQRKQNYIQRFLNAGHKQHQSTVNQQPQNTHSPQQAETETAKTSLIPAVLNTVMTKGQDTEQGRVYDGIIYKLQLLAKEGLQLINVIRKQGQQGVAFSAYKDDGNEFKVTLDNLSSSEKSRIIAFEQQQKQAPKVRENNNHDIEFND